MISGRAEGAYRWDRDGVQQPRPAPCVLADVPERPDPNQAQV